jgi:hypothetical protein
MNNRTVVVDPKMGFRIGIHDPMKEWQQTL